MKSHWVRQYMSKTVCYLQFLSRTKNPPINMKMYEGCILFFLLTKQRCPLEGFPGGAVVKNLPASAGDTGSSPGPGRSHMPQSN